VILPIRLLLLYATTQLFTAGVCIYYVVPFSPWESEKGGG